MHGMQPGMSPSRQADSVAICHSLMNGFRTPDLPKIRHIATPEKNRKNRTVGNLKIYEVITILETLFYLFGDYMGLLYMII